MRDPERREVLRLIQAYEELEQFDRAADHYFVHARSMEEQGTLDDAVDAE